MKGNRKKKVDTQKQNESIVNGINFCLLQSTMIEWMHKSVNEQMNEGMNERMREWLKCEMHCDRLFIYFMCSFVSLNKFYETCSRGLSDNLIENLWAQKIGNMIKHVILNTEVIFF